MDKNFLSKLKEGDKVIISSNNLNGRDSIGRVIRFTKNFIVVLSNIGFESKYKKNSGYATGESYIFTHLEEATDEAISRIYHDNFKRKVKHIVHEKTDWDKIPDEILEQVQTLLKPFRIVEDK